MGSNFITLTKDNIEYEHICCAFSNQKTLEGYNLKKQWLAREIENGYVFRKLDARAKVFIEYVPAECAWVPVSATNYLMVNCLWVSGQYKGHGYGKALLQSAIEDAERQGKSGLVTVVGTKKLPFLSDTKWMLHQGFQIVDSLTYGFSLLSLKLNPAAADPSFNACVREGICEDNNGLTIYYSNRCPFTENYINGPLREIAQSHNIALKIEKIETIVQAQSAPTPTTIFTAFHNGKYLTNDLSICTESKFCSLLKL